MTEVFPGPDRIEAHVPTETYFRPGDPGDYVRLAAGAMAAIAEVEEAHLGATGPTAEESILIEDPIASGRVRTYTVPDLEGWGAVEFSHDRDLGADREHQAVVVTKYPPFPTFDDEGLSLKGAAALFAEYEIAKAKAPKYRWNELRPTEVVQVVGGQSIPIQHLPVKQLIEAGETLRDAAAMTALARRRLDIAQRFFPPGEAPAYEQT